MKRVFKMSIAGFEFAFANELLPPDGTVIEVKDWLRNRDDHYLYECEISDVDAVEFMLRMDGLAESVTNKRRTICVEDEIASVLTFNPVDIPRGTR